METLLFLKESFPKFKVSLFTVPMETKNDWGMGIHRDKYLKSIKDNLSWIQIIPHGLRHNKVEVLKWDYYYASYVLHLIEQLFGNDGLEFERGFCAPHWGWNSEVVQALNDAGWWGAVNPKRTMLYTDKFYEYSHSINERFPRNSDLKLHGHLYGTEDDVSRCMDNLLSLPKNTEWHFCTDFLEKK
jgi:hypothetical protein